MKLKKIILECYDWTGESSFDELLEEALSENKELKEFYDANFRNL